MDVLVWPKRRLNCSAAIACTALLIAASPSALAQSDDAQSADSTIEEIIVTGTRIKRRDLNSISPLVTINRESLESAARPTLEEILNRMPQVAPDFGRTSNNPGDGTARVNLRGLGANRTLVLVNGRRVAPSGTGNAVDVNNLPLSLVERVEVISGGAAAVYGSDAIAGVINFITRDDIDGIIAEGSYEVSDRGDANTYSANLILGHKFANGAGNITAVAGILERDPLFAAERKLTRVTLEDNLQGSLNEAGSFRAPGTVIFAPVDIGNGPFFPIFDPDGSFRPFVIPDDQYNFAPINYLQVPLSRRSIAINADYEFSAAANLYTELSFANNEAKQNLAEVPAGGVFTINTDNPVLNAATRQLLEANFLSAPGFATVPYGRRMTEVGSRTLVQDRDYWRAVVGLRGELEGGWDYDTWFTVTDASEVESLQNDLSASRLAQGLLVDPLTGQCFDTSNGCVPVNIFGDGNISPEAVEFLRIDNVRNITDRQQLHIGFFATNTILPLWRGGVDFALGLEWRRDSGDFEADEVLFTGDTLGYRGQSAIGGAEEVLETYVEAAVPLLLDGDGETRLGLELGARYSDYKLAGQHWTYKAGFEWRPTDALRFRAITQRSVRAPNVAEQFEQQITEQFFAVNANVPDPCSASSDPVGNGNVEKCVLQGIAADQIGVFEAINPTLSNFVTGGNTQLEPETADSITAGFVWQGVENWSLALDYFDFEVEDTIGRIDARLICFDLANTANVFCENIQRDGAGNITAIVQPTSNRGALKARGVDLHFRFESALPAALAIGSDDATLIVSTVWTHLLDFEQQENPVSTTLRCAGRFGNPCYDGEVFDGAQTFASNRITSTASYQSGKWSGYLSWRWIDGTENAGEFGFAFQNTPGAVLAIPEIGSKSYVDLGIGYAFTDALSARLTVNNVNDTNAPVMANAVNQNNTDTGLFDIIGRSFFLSLTANFAE
ncbi:MAG: TonB-dependent receptor [Pseudomonadota bacterium]